MFRATSAATKRLRAGPSHLEKGARVAIPLQMTEAISPIGRLARALACFDAARAGYPTLAIGSVQTTLPTKAAIVDVSERTSVPIEKSANDRHHVLGRRRAAPGQRLEQPPPRSALASGLPAPSPQPACSGRGRAAPNVSSQAATLSACAIAPPLMRLTRSATACGSQRSGVSSIELMWPPRRRLTSVKDHF